MEKTDNIANGYWWRQVTRDQWRAFWAVFLGWIVDAFDFNIMLFILKDIEQSFGVTQSSSGFLATVTLVMRMVGGTVSGAMADRWGRKLPLMLSVLWFSVFACLGGFSTSYGMLLLFRALFGIGMGGEWAAGMPLVFEHWPTRLRGLVSGLLLGGWYWGYLLAAVVHQFLYPLFPPALAWRAMFWVALLPALFTLWIRSKVPESPVWLERQRMMKESAASGGYVAKPQVSVARIFGKDLLGTTLHTTLVIGSFMCFYYSASTWYPRFLQDSNLVPLGYLVAFNLGAIIGTVSWGRISEGVLGRRGAVTTTMGVGVLAIPLYFYVGNPLALTAGAFLMGVFGMGIWGMAPAYTNERFPTAVRGVGPGFCYHAAAAIGALMPWVLGGLVDWGMPRATAMSTAMLASGVLAATLIWFGPETRGRSLAAMEE